MFRSFFPVPKLFFSSAALWLLAAVLIWFAVGEPMRAVISIDRFTHSTVSAPLADQPTTADDPATADPAAGAPQTNPNAPASTESEAPAAPNPTAAAAAGSSLNFLTAERVWLYQYVIMIAAAFCLFWYFYKRNEWYWWSVVSSTVILLIIYFQVQVQAFVNEWSGSFFNTIQLALTQPGSVTPDQLYGLTWTIVLVTIPSVLVSVALAFYTSHYVFRWRKAMNFYYMAYWPQIRHTEGAAQRVQEDTMRFASIMEDLGTAFFDSLITLVVFLPLLWQLSANISELPLFGSAPGGLVWVALLGAAAGTALLAVVGIKLPGLNFANQRVEAAYRKELVLGEDYEDRAQPPTIKELFAGVQKNYFRLYFHYTYFNLARYGYTNMVGYVPLLVMAPSILAGTLTMGLYQQIQIAFGQVFGSFQFFARAWTVIVELQSVIMRLRKFESYIPLDQEPIKASVSDAAAS
ncbi:peptide/bleomycin uptake transporter [Devosia crocina]|uniref:Peptide/bleomycin uptake transporter n=1 Tax=Devosia crocina TaxID=429728 RepID=A0A1I7N8B8_9HYPH|nr:SbmA/BacA-like family transporter [Devosia crocina]SFV30895.1 peptide/bleomycin uptake transporter [Devosia crocina]